MFSPGGYYYKKLLIDPLPALIVWTQNDKIEAIEMSEESNLKIYRSINIAEIKSASAG